MAGPGFGPAPTGGGKNQLAMASLVTGAVSVVSTFCCCIPIVGIVAYLVVPLAGVAAVATGVMGLQHANRTGVGKNESIAGIALGGVGVLIGLIGILMLVLYGGLAAYGAMSQPPSGY